MEPSILNLQGCHEFSSELYQCLRTRVASEHFYFWLNSLKEFSQAEQCLSSVEDGDYSGALGAIAEALRSYQKGIASLTVSRKNPTHEYTLPPVPNGRCCKPLVLRLQCFVLKPILPHLK